MGKTHRKHHPQAARSRTTRSHKPRLLSNPGESSANLDSQLRALGLYPADTLGDGNCLFRALSDQLYGSPSKHGALRQAICDFIVENKERYGPFCEDERGLDVHIRCMRENGTYGGHLELSSFSHMVKRNVKVVQPGLVYVIEWDAGLNEEEKEREWKKRRKEEEREGLEMCQGTIYVAYHDWEHFSSIRNLNGPHVGLPNVVEAPAVVDDYAGDGHGETRDPQKEREKARKEKEKLRKITKVKLKLSAPPSTTSTPPPGLAEPLSSPMKVDLPAPQMMQVDSMSSLTSMGSSSAADSPAAPHPPPAKPSSLSPPAFRVHRSPKRSFDESTSSEDGQSVVSDDVERGRGLDKRSRMGSIVQGSSSGVARPSSLRPIDPSSTSDSAREGTPALTVSAAGGESESEGDDEAESDDDDDDDDEEEAEVAAAIAPSPSPLLAPTGDTSLSAPADPTSTPSSNSILDPSAAQAIIDEGYSSLSSLSDSDAAPVSATVPKPKSKLKKQVHVGEDGKALTRRQRKALGLPKYRGVGDNSVKGKREGSAGRIVIPGGRFKGRASVGGTPAPGAGGGEDEKGEWVKSGVGRVDVRGFRELKI